MLHFAENRAAKPVFIVLSLLLIVMTIFLTVAQTRESQDLQSSADTNLKNCAVSTNDIDNDKQEKELFKLINDYRKSKNLPELTFQSDLNRAAAWHSKDMAKRTKLDHKDSSGRMDTERIRDCGYNVPNQLTVENVALWDEPEKVFTEWKKSSGHNANMLCEKCVDVGLAREKGSDDHWYWTMDGGMQQPTSTQPDRGAEQPTATPSAAISPSISPVTNPTNTEESTDDEKKETTLEGENENVPAATQTLPETTTGIFLSVKLPGIGDNGNTDPKRPNRYVTVNVKDATGKDLGEALGIVSYQKDKKLFTGAVALPMVATSSGYLVNVRTAYSLNQTIASGFVSLEKNKTVILPEITIPVIDFVSNNSIGVADYFAFRNCIKTNNCRQRQLDVNDDGKVDILDNNIIVEIFARTTGQ